MALTYPQNGDLTKSLKSGRKKGPQGARLGGGGGGCNRYLGNAQIGVVLFSKVLPLGTDEPTKTDVFSEKFQMAFDPPPSFSENHIAVFSGIHDQRTVYNGKNLQYKFLDWK